MYIKEILELAGDIASVVIAVLALIVSIKALELQKRHNELSLMPICEMFTANYDDCLAVEIYNKGLGLMEVVSAEFEDVNGVKYINLHDLVREEEGLSYSTIEAKKVLMSGERVVLVNFEKFTAEQRKRIIRKLTNVVVRIKYRDVYDNEYRYCYPICFM